MKCRSGREMDRLHFPYKKFKTKKSVTKKQAISYYNTALEIEIWYFFVQWNMQDLN